MLRAGYDDALPQLALVLTIVTLSPIPLNIPSGIALAAIGCIGALAVVLKVREQPAMISPVTSASAREVRA
jgi:hypothetical protein